MDRKEAAERIQEVMTIIRTQHMCKDMDGECTTEDRETYIQRFEALRMAIEALQEPEIVHCKDCKYWDKEIMYCNHTGMQIEPDGYCVYGERKDCWVTKAREEE